MAKSKTPSVLILNPVLAKAIGLNEAIVVSQVEFWLKRKFKNDKHKVDKDGRKWTYNSYAEWGINFPFWSKNTIIRAIESAEKQEILLSKLKGRGRIARSKWYSLDVKKISSILLEVKTTQNGYSQSGSTSEGTQNGYLKPSRTTQNGYLAQAVTKNTNTKNTFTLKKDEGSPFGGKRELLPKLDTLSGTVTEIIPNNIKNIKARFPHLTTKEIEAVWIEQEGYWRKSKHNNYELEGKVISWLSKTINTNETKSDDEVWEMVENEQ